MTTVFNVTIQALLTSKLSTIYLLTTNFSVLIKTD